LSYRPEFYGAALRQIKGLPDDAFQALLDRVVELVDAPWDATVLPPGDDPARRETGFGGYGLLYFHVDEQAQIIRIVNVLWVG
jgi:hypothetical protein